MGNSCQKEKDKSRAISVIGRLGATLQGDQQMKQKRKKMQPLGHGTELKGTAPSQLAIMLVQVSGGIIAGATTSCITTPLDTIKTHLQVMGQERKSSTRQVVKNLMKDDGWGGLHRGFGPRFFSMSAWGTSRIFE
ncbi:hypothetical protein GH714_003220 [Hevea brasiliensis]|nr:hypothetical protein GH714_020542 [Hevea brasiliensis]KAF2302747.1 hypothetical protein GH714_003220 [Hevea brasiliensis]